MFVWETALIGFGMLPLLAAWWSNRHTALCHALFWASLAWLAWLWSAAGRTADVAYISLALTSCAGVAVLGARRPGAAAWNAVVAGLLAVQLLPLAQMYVSGGSRQFGQIWPGFVGATIAVGLLSYLPTRLGMGAATLPSHSQARRGAVAREHHPGEHFALAGGRAGIGREKKRRM